MSDLLWLGLLTISVIVNIILLEQVRMLNREIDMFLEDCMFFVEEQ